MDLERFWTALLEGKMDELLAPGCSWDDPIHDGASGEAVRELAIPRFASWLRPRAGTLGVRHLRTTADGQRVVVEHVLDVRDGLVWNEAKQQAEKADTIELPTAVVGQRGPDGRFGAIRVYFGTWAVLGGAPRMRVGPIAPDERAATRVAMDAMPVIRRYFEGLAAGDATIVELFEPDGYFREPANNYFCGRDQLVPHFRGVVELGGVGIEFLTATLQGDRLGLELQTIQWGRKTMPKPQAGFAIYELGPHGKLSGSRVYDSVIPPA